MKRFIRAFFFVVISLQAAHPAADQDLGARQDLITDFNKFQFCQQHTIPINVHICEQAYTDLISDIAKINDHSFVTVSRDGSAKIWRSNPETHEWRLVVDLAGERNHGNLLYSVAVLDEQTIITGDSAKYITVWKHDSETGMWRWDSDFDQCYGHTKFLTSIVVVDDRTIATGSYDRTVKIWTRAQNSQKWECVQTLFQDNGLPVTCIAVFDKNTIIVGHKYNSLIKIWSRNNACSPWYYIGCLDQVGSSRIDRIKKVDERTIATTSYQTDDTIFWHFDSDKNEWRFLKKVPESARFMQLDSYNRISSQMTLNEDAIVTGYNDGTLQVWQLPTMLEIAQAIPLPGENETEI